MIIQSVFKACEQVFLRRGSNITVFTDRYKTYGSRAKLTDYHVTS